MDWQTSIVDVCVYLGACAVVALELTVWIRMWIRTEY
jgi:hypothetical protein